MSLESMRPGSDSTGPERTGVTRRASEAVKAAKMVARRVVWTILRGIKQSEKCKSASGQMVTGLALSGPADDCRAER